MLVSHVHNRDVSVSTLIVDQFLFKVENLSLTFNKTWNHFVCHKFTLTIVVIRNMSQQSKQSVKEQKEEQSTKLADVNKPIVREIETNSTHQYRQHFEFLTICVN